MGRMYCCRQKNGSRRFCVCYRHTLNRHIIRKTWPMPGLESCLDAVGQALFISLTDFQSAFWQLPVVEEHVDRTAFVTRAGKYCFIFLRMPFGASTAPWLFNMLCFWLLVTVVLGLVFFVAWMI